METTFFFAIIANGKGAFELTAADSSEQLDERIAFYRGEEENDWDQTNPPADERVFVWEAFEVSLSNPGAIALVKSLLYFHEHREDAPTGEDIGALLLALVFAGQRVQQQIDRLLAKAELTEAAHARLSNGTPQ